MKPERSVADITLGHAEAMVEELLASGHVGNLDGLEPWTKRDLARYIADSAWDALMQYDLLNREI